MFNNKIYFIIYFKYVFTFSKIQNLLTVKQLQFTKYNLVLNLRTCKFMLINNLKFQF